VLLVTPAILQVRFHLFIPVGLTPRVIPEGTQFAHKAVVPEGAVVLLVLCATPQDQALQVQRVVRCAPLHHLKQAPSNFNSHLFCEVQLVVQTPAVVCPK